MNFFQKQIEKKETVQLISNSWCEIKKDTPQKTKVVAITLWVFSIQLLYSTLTHSPVV